MLAVLVSELISFFLLDSLGTMFKKLLFYSFQQNIIILLSQKNRVTAKKTMFYCTIWKPGLLLTQCIEAISVVAALLLDIISCEMLVSFKFWPYFSMCAI